MLHRWVLTLLLEHRLRNDKNLRQAHYAFPATLRVHALFRTYITREWLAYSFDLTFWWLGSRVLSLVTSRENYSILEVLRTTGLLKGFTLECCILRDRWWCSMVAVMRGVRVCWLSSSSIWAYLCEFPFLIFVINVNSDRGILSGHFG
jgi:hypothetical protein